MTTSHSSGPVRLRSIRVCTRRLTISMATGPFSPSRTVKRVQAVGSSDCAPIGHRLPGGFRPPSTPLIRGQRGLQVAHRGGAGHPQHIALTALAQLVAKPRVATQLIITRDPAVRHLIPPRVEHLQALLLPGLIAHLWWHVACLASLLVACPLLRQGQAEVEQGMVVVERRSP